MKKTLLINLIAISLFSTAVKADDALTVIEKQWAYCQYQTKDQQKTTCLEKLNSDAGALQNNEPNRNDLKIWVAIVKSTYAGAKGGFGALTLAKEAKALLEEVIAKEPTILDGSAYTSLGSLYYQVPGWPIGFGDDKKASELLQKALAINPTGIDPNYFYGDYLMEKGDKEKAKQYFEKALQAPARLGREDADDGRRAEISAKLSKLNQT